jgi:DNA-binding transcriptional MocR family regulator
MKDMHQLDPQERKALRSSLMERYNQFRSRDIALDMTRGKPCAEQLDLAMPIMEAVNQNRFKTTDGIDCRNYGGLDGIPEAKRLFADYMGVDVDEIIVGGNSSLNMMHDAFMRAMVHGMTATSPPWIKLPQVKFLCPSPGYDRHFAICEYLGIEMISIDMKEDGPDMDVAEDLVAADDSIKGIWCVPMYSNPTGIVYTDDMVDRLAHMQARADDFRIFWDNAYAVHHLVDTPARLKNILTACKQAGNPDRVLMWGSTSKITFASAGLAMMAGSKDNMERARQQIQFQTIGPDKLNQLRHTNFFENAAAIENHMKKHAAILKPKFDAVEDVLTNELGNKHMAVWSQPQGGYFVSIDTMEGCASAVIKMAAEAGVKLTPAGSTFPYKKDPRDRNIRIAPSFPPLEDIRTAMELVSVCIQIVSIDKMT